MVTGTVTLEGRAEVAVVGLFCMVGGAGGGCLPEDLVRRLRSYFAAWKVLAGLRELEWEGVAVPVPVCRKRMPWRSEPAIAGRGL